MIRQAGSSKVIQYNQKALSKSSNILTLVLDESTDVAMSDRPIFGMTVTIRDDIESLIGQVLQAGFIVGWLNYVDVTKFACLTEDSHYQEASHYFHAESNQLVLSKSLVLHNVDTKMNETKQLFTFSANSARIHELSKKTQQA